MPRPVGPQIEDEARVSDQGRNDRRYARSSAQVTPAFFASQIRPKIFNEMSATIEEVDDLPPKNLELPTAAGGAWSTETAGQGEESRVDPNLGSLIVRFLPEDRTGRSGLGGKGTRDEGDDLCAHMQPLGSFRACRSVLCCMFYLILFNP